MKFIITSLKSYLVFPFFWITTLLLLRIYEAVDVYFFSSTIDGVLLYSVKGFVFDLQLMLFWSIMYLPLFIGLYLLKPKLANTITLIITSLVVILQLLLIEYFRNMLIPLDQVVYSYTISELNMIVAMSANTNYLAIVSSIIVVLATSILFYKLLCNFSIIKHTIIIGAYILLGILSIVYNKKLSPQKNKFDKEFYYNISINKLHYFVQKSVKYVSANKQITNNQLEVLIREYQELNSQNSYTSTQYPLIHIDNDNDVLGTYFDFSKKAPNFVFIIVESLGRTVSGKNASLLSVTPFLDSLSSQSLAWSNFLSNSERTFGVLPNIFGSLPFGSKGFTEILPEMPNHQSLIKILNDNAYNSNFFYGGWSYFDKMDLFLKRNNIDHIFNETHFDSTYVRMEPMESGFSWGFHDEDLFANSLINIAKQPHDPRLDIYLTLSTHSPWHVPHEEKYKILFDKYLQSNNIVAGTKLYQEIQKNYDMALCFFYADNCIREYFNMAKQTEWFENTIFIITGDHRQSGFERKSEIASYHVPFIIYSPLLKAPHEFESVSTHLNITPTIVSMLKQNFGFKTPEYVHWLSGVIDTAQAFRNTHNVPFIKTNKSIVQYLSGEYFIFEEELFSINNGMYLQRVNNDSILKNIQKQLYQFTQINTYVCDENKICLMCN